MNAENPQAFAYGFATVLIPEKVRLLAPFPLETDVFCNGISIKHYDT